MYKLNPFNYPKVKGDKDIWGNKINDIFSTLFEFINNLVDIIQSQSSAIENKVDNSVLTTKLRDKVDNSVYSQKVEDIERKLTSTLTTENLNSKLQGITSLIEGKVDTVDFQRQVQQLTSSISTKPDLKTVNREITTQLSGESEKINKILSQKVEQSTQELNGKIAEVERSNGSLNSTVSSLTSTVKNKANISDLNEFIKTAKVQNTTLILGKHNGEQVQISLPHTVSAGKGLEFDWQGTRLGVRQEGASSYTYQNLQGVQGVQGTRGLTGADGVGITNITSNQEGIQLLYSLLSQIVHIKKISFTLPHSSGIVTDLSNYYDKKSSDSRYALQKHNHLELLSRTQADILYIPQSLGFSFAKQNTSVNFQNITANGDILAQGTVTGLSDKRLKQNIEKIQNPLKILKKLNGYTFTMNKERHVGVIAQEVQKALPEAVRETENGYLSVAYGNMVGLLIEANKELLKRIEVLEHVIKQ